MGLDWDAGSTNGAVVFRREHRERALLSRGGAANAEGGPRLGWDGSVHHRGRVPLARGDVVVNAYGVFVSWSAAPP
jgi:hypothetical protein